MLSPLMCGSFQDQEEDDFEFLKSCSLAQKPLKKPTRWHSFGGRSNKEQHNKNKNPYADRGLDKFSALLAELDSKRQKIYTQKGSEDISLLGFVYSNTDDYKPIVVRLKKKKQQQPDKNKLEKIQENVDKPKTEAIENNNGTKNIDQEPKQYARVLSNNVESSDRKSSQKNIRLLWEKIKLEKLSRPGYYVPVIMILILVFLVFFGRSFAILCTTLGWYFIPNMQQHKSNGSNLKKMKTMKKDYVKAFSYNNKMVSGGGGDDVHRDLRKTKTMQKDFVKALSYNNNKMMVSSPDHGLSSPTSVLTGNKSPPQRWP